MGIYVKLTIENIILKTKLFCQVIRIDHKRTGTAVGNAEGFHFALVDCSSVFKQEKGQEAGAGKHIV